MTDSATRKDAESTKNVQPRPTLRNGNPIGDPSIAPRCGAKTRRGTPCRGPAVRGRRRCRMHGGNSPGAPRGNQYALKHGRRTAAAIAARKERTAKTRQTRRDLEECILALRAEAGEQLTVEEQKRVLDFLELLEKEGPSRP